MAPEPEPTAKRAELLMRLTRLRVKNFRSIADIDIPLSPLTVLVGPNGSGKSNVVDALRFVRDVFARGLDQAVMDREGMGVIQRWGTEGEGITIGVTLTWPAVSGIDKYTIEKQTHERPFDRPSATAEYEFIFQASNNSPRVVSEILTVSITGRELYELKIKRADNFLFLSVGSSWETPVVQTVSDDSLKLWLSEGLLERIKSFSYGGEQLEKQPWFLHFWYKASQFNDAIVQALFYNLSFVNLRLPQQLLKETPFDEKGRNLAAVLRHLSRNESFDWNNLLFTLRQAITGFDTLEVETVGGYLATKLIYQTDETQPRTSYLGQESDGTIRMLGLLAALLQEPSQPFISIEEPEANIHPGALAVLAGVLDEASLRSQVLVTTHSPDMLDHLPVESFLVVEKVGDTTHVGPLDAGQMASVRKRLFTPGELLRMEGLQRQTEPDSAS